MTDPDRIFVVVAYAALVLLGWVLVYLVLTRRTDAS
jgi:hypothetical protein